MSSAFIIYIIASRIKQLQVIQRCFHANEIPRKSRFYLEFRGMCLVFLFGNQIIEKYTKESLYNNLLLSCLAFRPPERDTTGLNRSLASFSLPLIFIIYMIYYV